MRASYFARTVWSPYVVWMTSASYVSPQCVPVSDGSGNADTARMLSAHRAERKAADEVTLQEQHKDEDGERGHHGESAGTAPV